MNLTQMAAQVCADTGYVDNDDVTFAKQALRQRDDLIYRMGLWKDSLVQVNLTVDPENNEDHAEGVIYLPEVVERVIAVRTNDMPVLVGGLETFYRAVFDQFAQTGTPWEFAKLNPGWFTWRGGAGLRLLAADAGDAAVNIRIVWRDSQGVRYATNYQSGAQLLDSGPTTLEVTGAGLAAVNGTYTFDADSTTGYFINDADPAIYDAWAGDPWGLVYASTIAYQTGVPGLAPLISSPVRTYTTYGPGGGIAPAPTVAYGEKAKIEVEAVFKPATTGAVSLNPWFAGEDAGGTLAAADTASPKYQRIRLLPIPQAETTLKILAKAKYVPLDFDQAEPQVTGSHLALMAFAKHALRKRGGEHGAARDDLEEAMALVETLKKEEMQQEASHPVILPASGYGDAFFGPGRDGFFVG